MFEQLKHQFLASFDTKIAALEHALETQNAQALTAFTHQLAGSSGSYGFDDISALAIQIESLTQHQTSLDINSQEKTQQLIQLMKQVKQQNS